MRNVVSASSILPLFAGMAFLLSLSSTVLGQSDSPSMTGQSIMQAGSTDEYYRLALDGIAASNGLMDHNLAIVMSNDAETLRKEDRKSQAEQYESQAKSIEGHFQQAHPVCEGKG